MSAKELVELPGSSEDDSSDSESTLSVASSNQPKYSGQLATGIKRDRGKKGKNRLGVQRRRLPYQEGYCMFCFTNTEDDMICGELLKKDGVVVHYHCLLFASNLKQSGKDDDEGLRGFLPNDIRKELSRAGQLSCSFCKKKGAAVGCGVPACKCKYHVNCGLKNECFYLFCDNFTSFCKQHKPRQQLIQPRCRFMTAYMRMNDSCMCCLFPVTCEATDDVIRTNCCLTQYGKEKFQYYHRDCLRLLAIRSGEHHLRCPKCKDTEKFKKILLECGIYVPDRDAQWELEPDAFEDQQRYGNCILKNLCPCPQGFDYDDPEEINDWCLVFCSLCGNDTSAIHKKCLGVAPEDKASDWRCPECEEIEKELKIRANQQAAANTCSSPVGGRKRQASSSPGSERNVRPRLDQFRYESPDRKSDSSTTESGIIQL